MLADRVRMSYRKKVDEEIDTGVLIIEEILPERTSSFKTEGDFYVFDTGSYGGIRYNYIHLEQNKVYELNLQYQSIDSTGWFVLLEQGASRPIMQSSLGGEPNASTTQSLTFSFIAEGTGAFHLIISRNGTTGIFKLKMDSVSVKEA
jgi:hypothetical protein